MKLYIDENNKVVTMHEATSDMKCFEEFENRCRLPNYLNMKVNNLITLSEKVIARV